MEAAESRLEEPFLVAALGEQALMCQHQKRTQRFCRQNLRLAPKLWLLARGDHVPENAEAGAEAAALLDNSANPSVTLRLL